MFKYNFRPEFQMEMKRDTIMIVFEDISSISCDQSYREFRFLVHDVTLKVLIMY